MHTKFRELLHEYKLEAYKITHDKQSIEEITAQCVEIADDVLKQKYHYHFHKLPDADRAEIINMISNYTREAILPPVVEKIVQRQVTLEKKIEVLVHMLEKMLDLLSEEPVQSKAS